MRPLIALVRYLASDLLRSQRFLLPILLYVLLLAPLFKEDPGPPPQSWTVTALALYPVSCWLAVIVANTEDSGQRDVTIAAAGRRGRVAAGVLLTCLLADLLLVAVAVCWPMLTTGYAFSAHVVVAGVLGHAAVASTGTAIGLVCGRPVVRSVGWSVVLAGGALFLTVSQPWLPPVGSTLDALSGTAASTLTLAAQAAIGLVLSGAAAGVTAFVQGRR
ncbi:hypothetical protein [Actinophytocola oryzae]|uniref:ABC-2 type transport system permease protein n=1 Tax=Actinophytocola oryzae TaxID=502181 RepID=A0A4R7V6K6_9PSEU|nr:hypothetical protein [Actinophytocola oryzae]TDV43665.1 hypothetical protein CLV71_115127 [Actinophytocola oryzae]